MPRLTKKMLQEELSRVKKKLHEAQCALLERVTKEGTARIPSECNHPIAGANVIAEKLIVWCECSIFEGIYQEPFIFLPAKKNEEKDGENN